MTRRMLASDVLVGSLLIGVTYATPARLRPALGLGVAVLLSRQHALDHHRDLVALFDQRKSALARIAQLERNMTEDVVAHELSDRLDDVEAVLSGYTRHPPVVLASQRVARRAAEAGIPVPGELLGTTEPRP